MRKLILTILTISVVAAGFGFVLFRPLITSAARAQVQYLAASAAKRDSYLMLGDSRVSGLKANTLCGRPLVRIGFPGYGAAAILKEIRRRPIRTRAGTLIVAVGINDAKKSGAFEVGRWERDVVELGKVSPAAITYYAEIVPASTAGRYSSAMLDETRLVAMNAAMRRMGPTIAHPYLLTPDGHLKPAYTSDGTHLSQAGQNAWLIEIEHGICPAVR